MEDNVVLDNIEKIANEIVSAFKQDKKVLLCGNGGSAADAQHITAELVGRFLKERQALNVICLSANVATLTALGNDYGYDAVFARQVEAYGRPGGVLIGLSTSGNSRNVINAFQTAREGGMKTIAFTGQGGLLHNHSDIVVAAPSTHTPAIQQLHLCLYHYFCQTIEDHFCKK
ncbi:MAG: SIS domain-containing protein [Alphaproteobacteria bacterium]